MQARGEETMEEDVGEDYLEELIHRSMIQVVKRKWDGRENVETSLHTLLTLVDSLLMTLKTFLNI